MKVLYTESAKATWLFDLRLLNPHGLNVRYLMSAIVERYRFVKIPANPLDVKDGGLSFEEGVFTNSKGIDFGVTLAVYGDGLVADTFSNTSNTTEFLRDLSEHAKELGFPFPDEEQVGKSFTSILGVSWNVPLLSVNPRLDAITHFVENKAVTMDGKPRAFEFSGIAWFSEDVGQNKSPSIFKIERKIGQPFEANQYYSQAPLETDEHVAVLQELEKILKA